MSLRIVRAQAQTLLQFSSSVRQIAAPVQSDCQVEMIVGVVGIFLNGLLEIFGWVFLATTRSDNAQVVEYLAERQAGGNEVKGGLSLCEVPEIIGRKSKIEVGLARLRIGGWNLRKRGDCLFVLPLRIVCLAKFKPGFRKGRVQPDGLPEVIDLLWSGSRENPANVVFEGIQPD